jgi:hypothetical protein
VLETSHPPAFYLPREDVAPGALVPAEGATFCEWKGRAAYLDVVGGGVTAGRAAWYYPDPVSSFAALVGHVALYPARMDACFRRRRAGPRPRGRLLRRVDHRRDRRAVQGRPGELGLVAPPAPSGG